MQTLYIMQGPPGSGKSTIAIAINNDIWKSNSKEGCTICSTDTHHFELVNKETREYKYVFKFEKLKEYHALNLKNCKDSLLGGNTVIVDNTNIKKEHVKPYIDFAKSLNIPIVIIRCYGNFNNIHGVPQDKVNKMKSEMEDLSELI